jgi:hypothetical protein
MLLSVVNKSINNGLQCSSVSSFQFLPFETDLIFSEETMTGKHIAGKPAQVFIATCSSVKPPMKAARRIPKKTLNTRGEPNRRLQRTACGYRKRDTPITMANTSDRAAHRQNPDTLFSANKFMV